tara:strand:+ start:7718 stop:9019 length:1302 start_codon:yes stop_codon:yes gene_type:complete
VLKNSGKKRPQRGLFLFLIITNIIICQKSPEPFISNIKWQGNTKTEDYIIRREIRHSLNTPFDSTIAIEDRNRIDNLGLFSETSWEVIPINDGTSKLVYIVVESIQSTPPIAFPTYSEDTGWSLVGLWMVSNFRGRNQAFAIGGSLGGESTYGINFNDPWMFGDHVSLSLNLGRTYFRHRFLNKDVDVNSLYINFGKWFGSAIKTSAGIEIESKKFLDEEHRDRFFYYSPTATIKFDTRDIFWNPSRGILFSHYIYHQQGIDPQGWRLTLWIQSYSWFYKINNSEKKLVFAVNGSVQRKMGNKDEYRLDYFGNSRTVRGWPLPDSKLYFSGKENFRFGHESIYGSIEIRKELIPKYATPIGAELGLLATVFADAGIIANDWHDILEQVPIYGVGAGIRIPFPMVGVIRIDYGWGYRGGIWNSGALYWGIGQKF